MMTKYIRGNIFHFIDSPVNKLNYEYIADGVLEIENGKIKSLGEWQSYKGNLTDPSLVTQYSTGLIVPGFIDAHMHLANIDVVATPCDDLFVWLNDNIFPAERRLSNPEFATQTAEFFIEQLLRNGTTSAMVFNSIYAHAVDALFHAAEKKNMRLITGKTVGDRNLPEYLIETPERIYLDNKQLIQKWHKKSGTRLLYALTPRFVPTTTDATFLQLNRLKQEYPDVHVHTHISETMHDVDWSLELSGLTSYLSSYEKFGLVGKGTLLAHGIYLTDDEMQRIAKVNAGVAFCPTSNSFLGSGLFNLKKADAYHMHVGIGTDIGAGTSFSILQTMSDGYKAMQLQNQALSALRGFYLATLGSAKALGIDHFVGNFAVNKEADFVVLDLVGATSFLKRRFGFAKTLEDKLFILMMLGDDRSILATHVAGKLQYLKESKSDSQK